MKIAALYPCHMSGGGGGGGLWPGSEYEVVS